MPAGSLYRQQRLCRGHGLLHAHREQLPAYRVRTRPKLSHAGVRAEDRERVRTALRPAVQHRQRLRRGFKCESAGEECACSGSSGGKDPGEGGTPPPSPPETSCVCEPSKEMRCHAETVKCETNSDCTAGWTCASVGATSDCESAPAQTPTPPGESGAQGGAASAPVPAPDCRPSVELKQCVPPYYSLVGGTKGVDRESAGSPTLETGAGNGSANSADNAAPPTAPTAQDADADTSSAGCSMAHGSGAGSTLVLFGALGMFCALRRRRAS